METKAPRQRRVIYLSRTRFIIYLLAIVVVVGALIFSYVSKKLFGLNPSHLHSTEIPAIPSIAPMPPMSTGGYAEDSAMYRYPNPGYYGDGSIADTREFLKTSYSAQIKTRDVPEAVKQVKGAVREVEGRIDSSQSSAKHGYISFVVPKDSFESFRTEIESITYLKLYTESISSENLLGQKQSIEYQMGNATATLASLQQQKKTLDSQHAARVSSLNNQLSSIQTQLTSVRQQKASSNDETEQASLSNQEASLVQQEAVIRQSQAQENRSYATKSEALAAQIKYANGTIDNVNKQDTQFGNNIETVNGYISINWVSFWEMADIYSPISPIIIIIVLIILVWLILSRRGYIPKVELI